MMAESQQAASEAEFEDDLRRFADHPWRLLVGMGVVGTLLGILVVAWPTQSTVVVAAIFGFYLLASGVEQLLFGLFAPLSGGARALTLISGALSVVLGVACFRDRMQSVELLGIWVGVGWIMSGLATLFALAMPGGSRALRMLRGVLLLFAGVLMMIYPVSSVTTLVWMVGLLVIVLGLTQLIDGLRLRRAIRGG